MKLRHIIIIGLFAIINIGVITTLNFGGGEEEVEEKNEVFVQNLSGMAIENVEEKFNVVGYGTITSFNAVDISCEVQGKLSKGRKDLKPGVKFKKGEVLFLVNDKEARYNLRSRKSAYINIIAQLLPDIKVDFPTEFDKWNEYIESIKLNETLPLLPAWKTNKEKIFLSTRNVLTEYFGIKSLEEQLKKYYVTAPFNGVITEVFVSDQSVVNPGAKVLRLAQTDNFEVAVSVPASSLSTIEVGTKGNIYTTSGQLKGIGTVVRISEVINKNTQSIDVFIRPKAMDGERFIEGEYVQVAINETGDYKGARIPLNAVSENQVFIFSGRDSTLSIKSISILDENDMGVFVSGLSNKDTIITQEVMSYTDTTKYNVILK